jgi:hypothetical protein
VSMVKGCDCESPSLLEAGPWRATAPPPAFQSAYRAGSLTAASSVMEETRALAAGGRELEDARRRGGRLRRRNYRRGGGLLSCRSRPRRSHQRSTYPASVPSNIQERVGAFPGCGGVARPLPFSVAPAAMPCPLIDLPVAPSPNRNSGGVGIHDSRGGRREESGHDWIFPGM